MDILEVVGTGTQETLDWLFGLGLIPVGVAGLILALMGLKLAMGGNRYKPKKFLITPTEQRSFRYFEQELSGLPCRLFAQVRIADVISVTGKKDRNWWKAFGKISSKHVDLVVTRSDFSIAACVEIDDRSHERKDRIKRDELVDRIFKEAGLPLIRVKPGQEAKGLADLKSTL